MADSEGKEKRQGPPRQGEDYTIATPAGVIIAEVTHHSLPDSPRGRPVKMRIRSVVPKDHDHGHGH